MAQRDTNVCGICPMAVRCKIDFFLCIHMIIIFNYIFHRPSCPSTLFQTWETFLQEIEADSVTANDIAKTLSRQVRKSIFMQKCTIIQINTTTVNINTHTGSKSKGRIL